MQATITKTKPDDRGAEQKGEPACAHKISGSCNKRRERNSRPSPVAGLDAGPGKPVEGGELAIQERGPQ